MPHIVVPHDPGMVYIGFSIIFTLYHVRRNRVSERDFNLQKGHNERWSLYTNVLMLDQNNTITAMRTIVGNI